jgi:DNA-binding IclR family transcriptional regulator
MAKKKVECGEFCNIFEDTLRNRVLEFFLEGQELDYAVSTLAEELDLNRATAYNIIEELLEEELIKESRKIGNTQLYALNKEKPKVRALMKAFNTALQVVLKEAT